MKFDIYIPCDRLKPFVKFFAISETEKEDTYKVLPDTSLVIGFQYRGKLSHIEGGSETHLDSSGVTGLLDHYRTFRSSANIGTVLVYFTEGGAAPFFKVPIHELFSESLSLDNFMLRSELLILEEKLYEAKEDIEKIRLIELFLIAKLKPAAPDQLVLNAITLINRSKGNIRIKELTKYLNISQSPLEKRFRQMVGASPKKFAAIVRLKHTLKLYDPQNSLTDMGYEAGFYDQAHFIKEFKKFTGETPESFFLKK